MNNGFVSPFSAAAFLLTTLAATCNVSAQLHRPDEHNGISGGMVVPAPQTNVPVPGSSRYASGLSGGTGQPHRPQQVFSNGTDVPVIPPPVYAYRDGRPQNPVYLPLPGGYSQSGGESNSFGTQAGPLPLNDGGPLDQRLGSPGYPSPEGYASPPAETRQGNDFDYCNYCAIDPSWTWTLLPNDLLWQSYVGGPREPRLAQSIVYLEGTGWLWELEAGGRAGLLRYGSGPGEPLEGFQLDIWGGAFPRLNMNQNTEVDAVDFKVGVPLTWSSGPFQLKFEWYHISAHLGDEFLLRPENANFNRIDYLRDSIVIGAGYFPTPDIRLYAEADYAYNTNGGAEPWHFQFGVDYSPACPTLIVRPVPFFAINGLIRQEANYSGGINIVGGLQWRGTETNHVFRTGFHYYNGQSLQYSFINDYEQFYGWGMWLDF